MLPYIGFVIGGISLIGAVGIPLFMLKSNRTLTQQQIDEYERNRKKDEDEKEAKRKEHDNEREEKLRGQLDALSKMNQERFEQWRDTAQDLDDLWAFLQDEIVPWMRDAYQELATREGAKFPRPPTMTPRPSRARQTEP